MTRYLVVAVVFQGALAACQHVPLDVPQRPHKTPSQTPATVDEPTVPADSFVTLSDPVAAHKELCTPDMNHPKFPDDADTLTRVFCQDAKPGGVMPAPKSLAELLALLGLDFKDPNGRNGAGGNPAFAILGHSSALTARKVSTIAPTAFIFTPPNADGTKVPGFVAVGFDPGETFVEIASHDPTTDDINFYLVLFDKDCTRSASGCTLVDLLTPKLVTGWSNVRAYEMSTSLGNTVFDCHVCHQPVDSKKPILRMQENTAPFTHWFSADTAGGKALLADFHAANGSNEDYGGIPAAMIDKSDPGKLAALVKNAGFADQPNAFPSADVEAQVVDACKMQPAINVPMGTSAAWQAIYDKAVAGSFIAAPYHDVKVTDPMKLDRMTGAYKSWMSGASQTLPDIRDVFLDQGLRDMGFAPKHGLDGRGLLAQMCQECHNTNLDPMQTRQKFLVDKLDAMSRDEKDLAIRRIQMTDDTRLRMPPTLFRTTTADERQLMIDELRR